jgi:hypothetical protein
MEAEYRRRGFHTEFTEIGRKKISTGNTGNHAVGTENFLSRCCPVEILLSLLF